MVVLLQLSHQTPVISGQTLQKATNKTDRHSPGGWIDRQITRYLNRSWYEHLRRRLTRSIISRSYLRAADQINLPRPFEGSPLSIPLRQKSFQWNLLIGKCRCFIRGGVSTLRNFRLMTYDRGPWWIYEGWRGSESVSGWVVHPSAGKWGSGKIIKILPGFASQPPCFSTAVDCT